MKDRMSGATKPRDRPMRGNLLEGRVPPTHGSTKYSKLTNELDSPNRQFLDDTLGTQNRMFLEQGIPILHIEPNF